MLSSYQGISVDQGGAAVVEESVDEGDDLIDAATGIVVTPSSTDDTGSVFVTHFTCGVVTLATWDFFRAYPGHESWRYLLKLAETPDAKSVIIDSMVLEAPYGDISTTTITENRSDDGLLPGPLVDAQYAMDRLLGDKAVLLHPRIADAVPDGFKSAIKGEQFPDSDVTYITMDQGTRFMFMYHRRNVWAAGMPVGQNNNINNNNNYHAWRGSLPDQDPFIWSPCPSLPIHIGSGRYVDPGSDNIFGIVSRTLAASDAHTAARVTGIAHDHILQKLNSEDVAIQASTAFVPVASRSPRTGLAGPSTSLGLSVEDLPGYDRVVVGVGQPVALPATVSIVMLHRGLNYKFIFSACLSGTNT
jgi:hypothetical protein